MNDYRYFIDGRKLAILQKKISSESVEREEIFLRPSEDDSSAIYIRYTVNVSAPADENTELSVSRELSEAIVNYVKSKLLDDAGEEKKALYYMNKFYTMVSRHRTNIKGPGSFITVGYTGAIR